jgi:hypothetical protein
MAVTANKNQKDVVVGITNTNRRFSNDLVRRLVAFARDGREHGEVALTVKNSGRSFRGTAYPRTPSVSPWHGKANYLVVVCIGDDSRFPMRDHSYPGLKSAPVYDILDAVEALVLVLAHELQHCEQFKYGRRLSEIEAERSALRTLERFRRERADLGIDAMLGTDPSAKKPRKTTKKPAHKPKPAMADQYEALYDYAYLWSVYAPKGWKFVGEDDHKVSDVMAYTKEQALRSVWDRYQIERCENADCDYCRAEDEIELKSA